MRGSLGQPRLIYDFEMSKRVIFFFQSLQLFNDIYFPRGCNDLPTFSFSFSFFR